MAGDLQRGLDALLLASASGNSDAASGRLRYFDVESRQGAGAVHDHGSAGKRSSFAGWAGPAEASLGTKVRPKAGTAAFVLSALRRKPSLEELALAQDHRLDHS